MDIFKMRREEDILSYHDQHEGVKMNKGAAHEAGGHPPDGEVGASQAVQSNNQIR
jgi:hypothetical protein